MHALYHLALNDGKASDWLRPIPCQREGDKLPKGAYQSGGGYSTGVHLSEHPAHDSLESEGIQSHKFTGKGGRFGHT